MLKVINWSKYQSYKDRRPPWIRFHRTMLDNYEFQMMGADSRALLPMIWLLACEDEDPSSGNIDLEIKEISFRLRIDESTLTESLQELERCGFIECAGIVTKPLRNRNETVTTETETETETEKPFVPPKAGLEKIDSKKDLPPKKPKDPPTGPMHPELFEEFKAAYPKAANRHNWTVGWKKWNARINLKVEPAALIAGARKYSNHMDRTEKTGTVYILNPGTFLGPNEYYLQDWGSDELKSAGFDLDALLLATGHPK